MHFTLFLNIYVFTIQSSSVSSGALTVVDYTRSYQNSPESLKQWIFFPTIVKFLKNTCCMYCMLFTNFSRSGTSVICPISSRSSSDISPCSCKKKWLSNDKLLPVPVHGFPSSLSIKFHQISYNFQVSYHIFSYTFIVVFPILHWQNCRLQSFRSRNYRLPCSAS